MTWELAFFQSEFLHAYRNVSLVPSAAEALRQELLTIAEELAAEPRVLCHRDYHSRNLMVHRNRLVVIDFQDARMGPATYDLVSLLRDCYVDLSQNLVAAMTDCFLEAVPTERTADFGRRFDLMSVQRHLKALGTFGHQIVVSGRPAFAAYVPRTFRYLRRTLHCSPGSVGSSICSRPISLNSPDPGTTEDPRVVDSIFEDNRHRGTRACPAQGC